MTASESSLEGQVVAGRYRVERLLAEGGMGRVYRAVQIALERPVALKCIHPHLATSQEIVSRFLEEARLASKLSHPNIVQIYDFGQTQASEGSLLYLAMELLEGGSLDAELERLGALPVERTVDIFAQVLGALGEAHEQGIVHRDVKPENVILTPSRSGGERVKLIDFGIARASGAKRMTQAGLLVGTPHYIAPEMVRGEAAGPHSDLYAMGVMLFRTLTGKVPFDGPTIAATLMSHLAPERPDPRSVAPERGIPEGVAWVCTRALALDPKERYATADELSEALRSAARVVPRSAPASGSPRPGVLAPMTPPSSLSSTALPPVMPVSERYSILHTDSGIEGIRRLEQRAVAALGSGDRDAGEALLGEGITRARALESGELKDLAAAALASMGCRLAALLREDGKLEASRELLADVLGRKNLRNGPRALLLEQMARTQLALGARDAAEFARIDALLLAVDTGDDALLARLEDLERSTSLAPPAPDSNLEPPKRSTWRSRHPVVDPKRGSR